MKITYDDTAEEWESKSDDWRKGWRYGNGDETVLPLATEEFVAGYRYALNHPFGSVMVPM